MRQDYFTYSPQFKLVISGNHKPAIKNVDEAMKRRMHLVPFTVTIPTERRDRQLPTKLLTERDGILGWALAGCLAWQREGLRPPASVLKATAEYFDEEDAIGEFWKRSVNGVHWPAKRWLLFISVGKSELRNEASMSATADGWCNSC